MIRAILDDGTETELVRKMQVELNMYEQVLLEYVINENHSLSRIYNENRY